MSIFQEGVDPAEAGTPRVEDLVGEGKRYKSVEDLLKGKLEADRTIKSREQELQGLRTDLQSRLTIEEALKKAQTPPRNNDAPADPPKQVVKEDDEDEPDIDARVQAAIEKRAQQDLRQTNAKTVQSKLLAAYGDEAKANEVIKGKAKELGVSVKRLEDMALETPNLFFEVIGLKDQPKVDAPPQSSWSKVNLAAKGKVAAEGVNKPGTYRYYEEMRRNEPGRYWSASTQLQMDKDARAAKAEGRDFYG